jgi:putative salt-induced outer membrane protein YdiY
MPQHLSPALAATLLALASGAALAQATATVKEDGRWHAALGAAAINSSGNTNASSFNLSGDVVRATADDKWRITGNALYSKSEGEVSGNQAHLETRHDWNFTPVWFGYAGGSGDRDPLAELAHRLSVNGGAGYHLVKQPDRTFDVFGGLAYTHEAYTTPRFIDDASRDGFSYASLMIGEESTHAFSDTVSARQRLVALPNLRDRGQYRLQFEAALSVAVSKRMSLNVGFTARHDSDPGPGVK